MSIHLPSHAVSSFFSAKNSLVRLLGNGQCPHCDLHGIEIPNSSLSGAKLKKADLSSADLRGAYLRHARLEGVCYQSQTANKKQSHCLHRSLTDDALKDF